MGQMKTNKLKLLVASIANQALKSEPVLNSSTFPKGLESHADASDFMVSMLDRTDCFIAFNSKQLSCLRG